jgi:uncharacterized protein involved in exopolysaccharide biosynthesis
MTTPEDFGVLPQDASGAPVSAALPFARVMPIAASFWRIATASIAVGAIAVALSYLIKPTFTAHLTFVPPQQSQGGASAALASLGSLASLVGGGGGRTQIDQYVSFLETDQLTDRVIDRFDLLKVYGMTLRSDARRILLQHVRITVGKKDGLIMLEVDDKDPKRAAAIANQFVAELRETTKTLAVTDAQQRRVFFEREMKQAHDQLSVAEDALQKSGISKGAVNTQPAIASGIYARTNAAIAEAEVRLQASRQRFADGSAEIQTQEAAIAALRGQLGKLEAASSGANPNDDYVNKYRDFKYRETMFELYAKQYELARVDEAREGALIQVVDPAQVPDKKSKPRRSMVGLVATLLTFIALGVWVTVRASLRESQRDPVFDAGWSRLRRSLKSW